MSETKKAVLPLFFFALCIAFMPLLALNSRVAELSLPLAFCPQISLVSALYLMILTRPSHKSPEVHKSLGIHVGLTAKREERKGGRREGRRKLNTSK